MAFVPFNHDYITKIDKNNISEEFINYFEGLDIEGQTRIIESRPDLADVLGYKPMIHKSETAEHEYELEFQDVDEIDDTYIEAIAPKEEIEKKKYKNIYEDYDFSKLEKKALVPLEIFTIDNNRNTCIVHRQKLQKVNLQYSIKTHYGYKYVGYRPLVCLECKRLFMNKDEVEGWRGVFTRNAIDFQIHSINETNKLLMDKSLEIKADSKTVFYIPDVWNDEAPLCPLHKCILNAYPYYVGTKRDKYSFEGYVCAECDKTLIRKSVAIDIDDECNLRGIQSPKFEPIREKIKIPQVRELVLRPQYVVENGKRIVFPYKKADKSTHLLCENNIVVVSDSDVCSLDGHSTEEVDVAYYVNEKRGGRQLYISSIGYCRQCNKYYIDEENYKSIYAFGRPEFAVIKDLINDDYLITSGEVYNQEKQHLLDLEKDIKSEENQIRENSNFVGKFETGSDWQEIADLQWAKSQSDDIYGERLNELISYQDVPYRYRVDIIFANKTESYYIGTKEIKMNNRKRVISMASDMGRTLVNARTNHYIKDGKQYDVKLLREFDIKNAFLYGYRNQKTDEDAVFRAGITDPILIRVLNQRKRQHELIDIFITIQENQNAIIDENLYRNIIVQGCAGSGKTVIMLHRLYTLKENNPSFDFDKSIILTPNENFNLHIKGLAETLQIGSIDRLSVERYYCQMVQEYSEELLQSRRIANELSVNKFFVDYIYSDDYIKDFKKTYNIVVEEKKRIYQHVYNLYSLLGEEYFGSEHSVDAEIISEIKRVYLLISSRMAKIESKIDEANNNLDELNAEKQRIIARYPEVEKVKTSIIIDGFERVRKKLKAIRSDTLYNFTHYEEEISKLMMERAKIEARTFLPGKNDKLEKNERDVFINQRKKDEEEKKLKEIDEALLFDTKGKDDLLILAWMKQQIVIDKSIREEIDLYNRINNEFESLGNRRIEIDEKIAIATEELLVAEKERYSEEVYNEFREIELFIEDNSDYKIYKEIFDRTVRDFVKKIKISLPTGMHRYDLYSELHFCLMYYGKTIGNLNYICFDEGQDIARNEYKLIRELNGHDVIYNIFGDTNQLLKKERGIDSWEKLKADYSMKLYFLNENYRNTNQITEYCNEIFNMNVRKTGVDGKAVKEIPRRELEKELSNLSITNDKVAVLLPRRVKKKNTYLEMEIIPEKIRSVIGNVIDNGRIAIMYVDEIKGIEFDKVFVVSNQMTKNEKYIAYTRALSELIIVIDSGLDEV